MKRFVRSPLFYLAFVIASAIAHYLLISMNLYDLIEANERMSLFMPPASPDNTSFWSAGPLIYAYFKPFSALFSSASTGFHLGSAMLAATFTFALLRFFANLVPAPVIYGIGIWSVISPTTVALATHEPHILLGFIFLLLMLIALMRHKTILVIVFILHLFLTLQILGWLSLTLLILYRTIYPRYHKRPQ
jgi:Zn-dependent protease